MPLILADATVSTAFLVVSYLAIGAAAIVILVALFDPGIRYKISSPETPDNTSGEFTRTLELWTDSKVNQSVDLTVLTNGNVFYEEELASIRSAATSVCLYIFKESEIGRRFVEALTERARAGVRVNVVLDALGSASVGKHFFHEFTSSGGKLSWYNSGRWNKLPRFNNRTHRELLIIDGKTGFIGGAGVADQWFKERPKHPRWRDTMVKVVGVPVLHLQAAFAENWLESSGELLTGPDYFPDLPPYPEQECATLVVSSSPTSGGITRARVLFQLLIASAQKCIHITTPYFLPDKGLSDELVRAINRGVEVKVVAPGRRSDIYLTRASSRGGYGKLLKAGASIYEYSPAMIHAKVLVIDELWGVVGSANCDYRSFGLNDEVNLVVRDAEFVDRLEQDFVADVSNSQQITYEKWRDRNIVERAPELFGWILERQQ